MSRAFIVVYEARADFEQATELADRVLLEAIDWLEEILLDTQRRWVGDDPYGGPLTWKSVPSRARALGINVRGHFDDKPCEQSHYLTAGKDNRAKRSPKRVLAILTAGNRERERRCWVGTPLTVLRDRGLQNGLADYLNEAKDRLVPLVAGH